MESPSKYPNRDEGSSPEARALSEDEESKGLLEGQAQLKVTLNLGLGTGD